MNNLLSRAMRLLAQRDHSEVELRRKLAAQPFSESESSEKIDQVIAYCYANHWLNEKKFAESYIRGRSQKGYGPQRIWAELIQKGVKPDVVSNALADCSINWFSLAEQLILKRTQGNRSLEWKEKARLSRFLYQKGFPQEHIHEIFKDFDE